MREVLDGASRQTRRAPVRSLPHDGGLRGEPVRAARDGRPDALSPAAVLALQRAAGNAAVQQALAGSRQPAVTVQRGRVWKAVKGKITKERKRKTWKKGRQWPEQGLKGRLLERVDKYMFRIAKRGYVDMNKIMSNFPAIDGIADGKFRQVKAYLALGVGKAARSAARREAVQRIVKQAGDLEEKSEKAAYQLAKDNGKLLRLLLDINTGRGSTAGRTGKAPYTETSKVTKVRRTRHMNVLPKTFSTEARKQVKLVDKDPVNNDFDIDALGQSIVNNMVLVVPNDLVADVKKELKSSKIAMDVEGASGVTSTEVKSWMDKIGYTPSKRGQDDDDDYVG